MTLSADNLLDRMRLKSQVVKWRSLAIAIATLLVASFVMRSFNLEGQDSIARISVEGIILEDRDRDKKLDEVKRDDNIKAVVVYINSPGGTIVGGEDLYLSLRSIAEKKPVVAVMGDVAASGGYMAAIAADRIYARSGTITGSVGVLLQSFEVTELAKKVGVNLITFKSGELKASPSPLEKVTPKAEAVINASIQDGFNFFVDLVKDRRMLPPEIIAEISDGRIFTGRQAIQSKLIDALGGENDAIEWLHQEKNIDAKLPVKDVDWKQEKMLLDRIYSKVMSSGSSYMSEVLGNGIMAVWKPSL
jgi:protease-4